MIHHDSSHDIPELIHRKRPNPRLAMCQNKIRPRACELRPRESAKYLGVEQSLILTQWTHLLHIC